MRRIIIKDKSGKEVIVLPLTIRVVGAVIAPALVTECTIAVERE